MKITVIMLTYNREKYLDRVITSVLEQTYSDFEYVIVNNGSEDQSRERIRYYMEKDTRIRLVELPKSNIAVGRAAGIAHATGEYIAFIDDDDWLCKDMLETLVTLAESKQADISFCGSYREEQGVLKDNCIFEEELDMTPEEAVVLLLKRKKCNAALPTKLIKKELFGQVVFPPDSVHEDIFVTYKLFAMANKVVASGKPKYCFVRHGGNISAFTGDDTKLTPEQLEEYFGAFRERTEFLSEICPKISDYAQYSEWSYMISMCNKIEKNKLEKCYAQLLYARGELLQHYEEFYDSPYIEEFEKEFMHKYIEPYRNMAKDTYCSDIERQIEHLKNSESPIILFGAMAVGFRAKMALESMGRKVTCFCDNDVKKQGTILEGVAVYSASDAYTKYPDADVFLCMLNPKNIKNVTQQMKRVGFSNVYTSDALQYLFQVSYLRREVDSRKIKEAMYMLRNPQSFLTLGTIGISTGTHCTLNCRDCIAQNPHMKKREHYDKNIIIKGMQRLSETVDAVEAFHIVGGEPFLYPWLTEVCEAASRISNVERVTIFTNGTIVPEREVLEKLRNTVLSVRISFYRNLGYDIKPLTSLLDEYGIVYEIDDSTEWTKHPYPECKNRTPEELAEIYGQCFWRTQPGLRDGKLRWCSFAESISPFFDVGECEEDYVDVLDEKKSAAEIRAAIASYKQVARLAACNYCDAYKMMPAERGVQKGN